MIMKRTLVLMLLVASSGVLAANEFNLPPGRWWENEHLIDRVGLTDEQREQITGLVYDHAHRMIGLNADVKRAELELASLVAQPEFEVDRVRAAFAAFQAARQALERERFEMLLAVRETLTAEQWQTIQELQKEMRRRRWSQERGPQQRRPPAERFGGPQPEQPPGGPFS
jgi:Spy/CpxP family protein refolding chaperone